MYKARCCSNLSFFFVVHQVLRKSRLMFARSIAQV